MRHRGLFVCLALVAWAWSPTGMDAAGLLEVQPSAVGALRSGELVVLDAQQGLFLLSPSTGRVHTLLRGFGEYEALDMATAFLDGGDAIFVTMNLRSTKGGNRAKLWRFNAKGVRTGEWTVPGALIRLSGVTVDAQNRLVYVASTQPPEMYKLDLSQTNRGPLLRLSGVPGAERLGSMALDGRRGRLLIADPFLGRVSAYQLSSGRSEPLVEKVGEPSELAFDAANDRLFISDPTGGSVLVAELGGKATSPRTFAQLKELREPLGLALDGAGGLWVSDRRQHAVFRISRSGQLLNKFPLLTTPLTTLRKITPH